MKKRLSITIVILVLACILTGGCTTEDSKNVQDITETENETGLYLPEPVTYSLDGNYSIVSFTGYSEDSGFSYEPFTDKIVISGQNDRLFTVTDSYGRSYYAVYDEAGEMITSYSGINSSEPWQIYGQIVSDSEIRLALTGRLNGSLYADAYNIIKDGSEETAPAYPDLTGRWVVTRTEVGSQDATVVKMDGPVFHGSYSVTADSLLMEYDFVGAVYAASESTVYAIAYDEEGDFGQIQVSGGELIWNWINEDGAFTDVHVRESADEPNPSVMELTDISGDYQDQYYTIVSADGFEENYSDYPWSLSQAGSGSYTIASNGTDSGFMLQYPDGSVFFMDKGYYYNGWFKDGVMYSFVADEDGAEMYLSPRI